MGVNAKFETVKNYKKLPHLTRYNKHAFKEKTDATRAKETQRATPLCGQRNQIERWCGWN